VTDPSPFGVRGPLRNHRVPRTFSRRALLAALPASLAACAAPRLTPPLPPRGTRLVLAPVNVARDRIIRIDVGLRPFRPAGFVVRNEMLGDKMIVHNYGHGGGVTLSWGTAALALKEAPPARHCAVLGCGAVGLATTRLAQERGMQVTIYAAALPPETTSNVAGAQWWPSYVYDEDALTPAFRAQFVRAAHLAYHRFQTLPGEAYGISWRRNYSVSDTPFAESRSADRSMALTDLCIECRSLEPRENPFCGLYTRQFDTMMIEPALYLSALMRDVRETGGRIVVRRFNTPADILRLPPARRHTAYSSARSVPVLYAAHSYCRQRQSWVPIGSRQGRGSAPRWRSSCSPSLVSPQPALSPVCLPAFPGLPRSPP
jgi:D-amino-acid oxidase